ncbi:MAG: ribose-phosphate diphosphokinase [Candidatus Hermodarchaeota archaeon]
MNIIIVGKRDFAGEIAERVPSSTFIEIEEKIFPDGEICPRLLLSNENQLTQNHVVVAMQLRLNQPKNQYLISLLWTIYNIKQYNPAIISCFMPYHLYSRQDRESQKGESVSIKYLASALESAGINNFVTINSHIYGKTKINTFFLNSNAVDFSAISLLGNALKSYKLFKNDVICFSPDEGALLLAEEAAKAIGSPFYGAIRKQRDPKTGEIIQDLVGIKVEVQDRSVLIIDDLVSSGGTMIGAAQILREKGAKEIIFAYVHAVHSPENFNKMLTVNPSLILATDTIKTDIEGLNTVSIIPILSNWILENS